MDWQLVGAEKDQSTGNLTTLSKAFRLEEAAYTQY